MLIKLVRITLRMLRLSATVTDNYLSLARPRGNSRNWYLLVLVNWSYSCCCRTALDVDQAGTDNSTDVTLANTNYLSISGQEITGGTVPVSSGGTGASTAAAAELH